MKKFLAMWDCYGLESLIEISKFEQVDKQRVIDILAGKKVEKNSLDQILLSMKFRARYNSQRCYRIYAFTTELSECELRKAFDEDTLSMTKLIKKNGLSLF